MRGIGGCLLAALLSSQASAAESYENPVDGKTYVTSGQWQTYTSRQPAGGAYEKVRLDQVRLLSAQEDFEANGLSAAALAAYIRLVEARARAAFGSSTQKSEIILQFECARNAQKLRIAFQGTPEKASLQAFYDAVSGMEKIKIEQKPLVFQVRIKVSP